MKVRDLMTAAPDTVRPDTRVSELAELMERRMIRHAPVLNDRGGIVGVVSHRDVVQGALRAAAADEVSEQLRALEDLRVESVMSYPPQTVEADEPISNAAWIMLENKFGCLLVTEGTRLVGILTEADFVRHVAEAERKAPKVDRAAEPRPARH